MRLTFCYRHIAPYHHAQLNALAGAGLEVTAITLGDYANTGFGGATHPATRYGLQPVRGDRKWREFLQGLEASRPDAVFVPGWGHSYALAALGWAVRLGIPCIAISDSQQRDLSRNFILESLKRSLVGLFSAGFVAGRRSRDYLAQLGMPAERIVVGSNVVDNDYFIRSVDALRAADDHARLSHGLPERYFLAVNRLIDIKNTATIIRAYAGYCAAGAPGDWGLVIVGAGPMRDELQQLAAALGVDTRVHFAGAASYEDIPRYFAFASAFVLASRSEPWGLVVNEAMCAGLPVLVSEACGSSADLVVEGVNGFVFAADDVESLAARMGALASGQPDVSGMGRSGREMIQEWSLTRYVDRVRAVAALALAVPREKAALGRMLLLNAIVRYTANRGVSR